GELLPRGRRMVEDAKARPDHGFRSELIRGADARIEARSAGVLNLPAGSVQAGNADAAHQVRELRDLAGQRILRSEVEIVELVLLFDIARFVTHAQSKGNGEVGQNPGGVLRVEAVILAARFGFGSESAGDAGGSQQQIGNAAAGCGSRGI